MNSTGGTSQAPILRVLQSKDQTRAFYNKISGVYDALSERSEAPMRKAGFELLSARAGESVLEIGFGTGHTLVSLAKAVGPKGKVFGIDLSDKMLKAAKANLAKASLLERAGIVVSVVQGSAKNFKITQPGDIELAEYYLSGGKA